MLFKVLKKAVQLEDEGMLSIVKAIQRIPTMIRDKVLKAYVKKCKDKHCVAFFQWRMHFAGSKNVEELQEVIEDRTFAAKKAMARRTRFYLADDTQKIND